MELDGAGRPHAVFSVRRDGVGLRPGQGGFDLRYHYGWWDGERWTTKAIAYAGTRLYAGEDDYSGLAALHPRDPKTVYISTDADPKWDDERTALVWMRGGYYDNHGEWDAAVVAMILDRVL